VAELVGVTYQQAHKYEQGINRVAAGRLFTIARALGVDVGYFFEGLDGVPAAGLDPHRRRMAELARDFAAITDPRRREALCNLARVLAGGPGAEDGRPRAEA
jgi:transcriptional regulator with XRE-family HTH domain